MGRRIVLQLRQAFQPVEGFADFMLSETRLQQNLFQLVLILVDFTIVIHIVLEQVHQDIKHILLHLQVPLLVRL